MLSTSSLCVVLAALAGFSDLSLVWRGGLRLPFPAALAPWPGMEGQVGAVAWGGG